MNSINVSRGLIPRQNVQIDASCEHIRRHNDLSTVYRTPTTHPTALVQTGIRYGAGNGCRYLSMGQNGWDCNTAHSAEPCQELARIHPPGIPAAAAAVVVQCISMSIIIIIQSNQGKQAWHLRTRARNPSKCATMPICPQQA